MATRSAKTGRTRIPALAVNPDVLASLGNEHEDGVPSTPNGKLPMTDPTPLLIELMRQNTAAMNTRFDTLEESLRGVHQRLDQINGRVRKGEVAIGRIKTVFAIAGAAIVVVFGAVVKHFTR